MGLTASRFVGPCFGLLGILGFEVLGLRVWGLKSLCHGFGFRFTARFFQCFGRRASSFLGFGFRPSKLEGFGFRPSWIVALRGLRFTSSRFVGWDVPPLMLTVLNQQAL